MIPYKAKDHIEPCAEKLGIPAKHLEWMVKEYYSELKDTMENFGNRVEACESIEVHGLGFMRMKVRAMEEEIAAIEKKLHYKVNRRKLLTDVRSDLRKKKKAYKVHRNTLWVQWKIRVKKKELKKKNNESGRQDQEGLGEPQSDS